LSDTSQPITPLIEVHHLSRLVWWPICTTSNSNSHLFLLPPSTPMTIAHSCRRRSLLLPTPVAFLFVRCCLRCFMALAISMFCHFFCWFYQSGKCSEYVYSDFLGIFIYLPYRRVLVFGKCRIIISRYRYRRIGIPYRCNIGHHEVASHSNFSPSPRPPPPCPLAAHPRVVPCHGGAVEPVDKKSVPLMRATTRSRRIVRRQGTRPHRI
jgi:hypothetical protein